MDIALNRLTTKKALYERIAKQGTVSKGDLMPLFDIKTSTMNRLIDELLSEKLIIESGFGPSNGGRKPILFRINPSWGYFFGLEISRFYSTLGLYDMAMNPMSITRWRMDEDMTPEKFIKQAATTIRSLLLDHKLTIERIKGIGIGAVGPLDRDAGIILNPLYFPAKGWMNVPICKLIEEQIGIMAKLDNGANTALLGENWAMRESQLQHMLYVHAGVSLRSSMMSYGHIVHGSVDREGSIGQMIIQTDGPRLHDKGNYGALEAYVSVQAIERKAQSEAKLGRVGLISRSAVRPEDIRYDLLLSELALENPVTLELFLKSARHLGIGLANLINIFHPECIVLGGTLINSHESFYRTAIEVAIDNTYHYPEYTPHFSKGILREDAVATGAALMMWRDMSV
ncbi:ROK family protein [Paenibacillus sp. SCIV0701]|uniref:ROK family protein n=2 Tax=Paenibacillus soyae TaxID=2969249 RepID=A0A9X2S759_9BACL|nr:ROK family protein [Paenibacillus soyae]